MIAGLERAGCGRVALASLALAVLGLCGCRPGGGDRCYWEGECRGGLLFAAGGAVLAEGQCVADVSQDLNAGACVDHGAAPQDDAGMHPPPSFDLGTHAPGYEYGTTGTGTATQSGSGPDASDS